MRGDDREPPHVTNGKRLRAFLEMTTSSLLFDALYNRVARDKADSDHAYFNALSFQLEYVLKLVTCGLAACIGDDVDRHRYSIEHRLVRANSVGDWTHVLDDILGGPAAQFARMQCQVFLTDLTERASASDWRHSAVVDLSRTAIAAGVAAPVGRKVALRQLFSIAAQLRNRSRGHGAIRSDQCTDACPFLANALDSVIRELKLFGSPWAYLHRNLSGKYRVTPLLGDASPFEYLKRTTGEHLPNGVYFYAAEPIAVPLVFSDPEVRDIYLPNGNHGKDKHFEVLSYVTNEDTRKNGAAWSAPPGALPPSETEGGSELVEFGKAFANVPPGRAGYVPRPELEKRVRRELLGSERHPIVTLTGPGGIGKTSVAIAALLGVNDDEHLPYEVILWISARDIDLLESGPKPVAPRVVTQLDIARAAVELLEPKERHERQFSPIEYLQGCLATGAAGTTLFVLDNFETVQSPSDVFLWIDTHIRSPNKVLITTRSRDFVGDYPIEIAGMTAAEATTLVSQHSRRLGVSALITSRYREELLSEADGHPYVIRILLGQVAAARRAVKPERIVANSEHILRALFERTYRELTPSGQRVLLLLCSWRVFVPEIALEAVLLRPGAEKFDVSNALDELERFSLVERSVATDEGAGSVGVPLAAAAYGRSKLEASPFAPSVDEDRKLLMEFGPGAARQKGQSVLPRIYTLYKAVAEKAQGLPAIFEERRPVLEYLAMRVPTAYLELADLVKKVGEPTRALEDAKGYVRCFLESAQTPNKSEAWWKLAGLCEASGDTQGEVHAISEVALLPTSGQGDLAEVANRLNNRIRQLKGGRIEDAWSAEVNAYISRVIEAMERHLNSLVATECSALAWLHLNVGNAMRAKQVADIGIEREPRNKHCLKLIERLRDGGA